MLFDKLVETINELDEYVSLLEIANDTKAQERMEIRFSELNDQFDLMIAALQSVKQKTDFCPSSTIVNDCKKNVELIRHNYEQKKSDESNNQEIMLAKRALDDNIKNEWNKYYARNSVDLVNMLQTVIEITDDKVVTQQIINRIEKGKAWSLNDKNFEFHISGMNDGKRVITQLSLDESTLEFLKAVSQKNVTLADLKPEISEWINKEGLAKKFLLVFDT